MPSKIEEILQTRHFGTMDERIRRRAHKIYLQRAGGPGSALGDWLQAEQEILREQDDRIDEASMESFPASDSPAYR